MQSIDRVIGITFILAVAAISAYFYDHRGRNYARGKHNQIESDRVFGLLYTYIRFSTLAVSLLALGIADFSVGTMLAVSTARLYMGIAISAVGLSIFLAAKVSLGKNYSPCFDSFQPFDHIRSGCYAYVRHPIYTANLIILAGAFLISGNVIILINWALTAVFYWRAAEREENALVQVFGSYREYQDGTGRFVPKVKTCIKPILELFNRGV